MTRVAMCLVLTQRVVTIPCALVACARGHVCCTQTHARGVSMAAAARPFFVGFAMLIAAGVGIIMGAMPWQGRLRDDDLG